jgi:ABC-type lipoprotein release transport system permease subunit
MLVLAWRNLWRNARRTIITLAALILGVAAIVGMRSYRDSMFKQVAASITRDLVGHMQVHAKGYQDSPALDAVVHDARAIEARIGSTLAGAQTERRVIGAGLAGAGDASAGALITGIDPSQHALAVKRGAQLSDGGAVIGLELAAQLGVDVGGEIVLVGQAVDGSMANDRYRVVGVADAGTFELNATAVYLTIADAQDFFGLGDAVHTIVVRLPDGAPEDLTAPIGTLRDALDLATLEALTWNEILPELTGTIESKREGQKGVDFVIFFIVALGVWNAMTMATYERTREFGVMLALGTRPRRIVSLIALESLWLGALALAGGVALVFALFAALGDLNMAGSFTGGADFAGVRLPDIVHLAVSRDAIGAAAIVAFATVLFGGLLPAIRAARLAPVEAMGSF